MSRSWPILLSLATSVAASLAVVTVAEEQVESVEKRTTVQVPFDGAMDPAARRVTRMRATPFDAVVLATGLSSPAVARTDVAPTRLVPVKSTGTGTATGSIRGDAGPDFVIRAGAGQALAIELQAGNPSACFNLLPPGSNDVAMFIGSSGGSRFRGTAPIAGDYLVRVYLMRSAARRDESSTFTLTARVTGVALVPLPPSKDAVVPGTWFHARATVRCAIPYQPDVRECEAAVVRYGRDRTATVELRAPMGFVRRILFVKGRPTASDAAQAPVSKRHGDTTTVSIGTEERYELPDALLSGG